MLSFLARRFASSAVVMLIASYVVYVLTCFSSDPLANFKLSQSKGKAALIEQFIHAQHLDVTPWLRYFIWLGGVLKVFTGHFTLGLTVGGQTVTSQLSGAMAATMQLLFGATLIAIVFGVGIGIVSALRQYTAFDYGITFVAFLFFSLPVVWLAVLLKQYLAIDFNNFLGGTGNISLAWIIGVAVAFGLIAASLMESYRRRLVAFVVVGLIAGGAVALLGESKWFVNPRLGFWGILVLGIASAVAITALSAGIENRRALYASLTTAAIGIALYYPLPGWAFNNGMSWGRMGILAVIAVAVGLAVGWLWGGPDRRAAMRTAALVAFVVGFFIATDQFMQYWQQYTQALGGRPIGTLGSETPNFPPLFWYNGIDHFTHLLLPTVSLMLASLASYSRYARASMLEVMNQDYIRTARSKGITERSVVMRHAFRNALIPVVTIVTLDFGALIGGTLVTENVFGFQGMGALFEAALPTVDVNTVMGFFVVTGIAAILFNVVADVIYSALDPRIRVTA